MASQVTQAAVTTCSFGVAPSVLNVPPINRTMAGLPAANIMDHKPFMNVMPFGMCTSLANPAVAAATSAAMGVLTPMPCVPVTVAPWAPGSPTVLVGNMPALNNCSKCACAWGGVISVSFPGQIQVSVP